MGKRPNVQARGKCKWKESSSSSTNDNKMSFTKWQNAETATNNRMNEAKKWKFRSTVCDSPNRNCICDSIGFKNLLTHLCALTFQTMEWHSVTVELRQKTTKNNEWSEVIKRHRYALWNWFWFCQRTAKIGIDFVMRWFFARHTHTHTQTFMSMHSKLTNCWNILSDYIFDRICARVQGIGCI